MKSTRTLNVDTIAKALFVYEDDKRVAIFPWGDGPEDRSFPAAATDALQFLTTCNAAECGYRMNLKAAEELEQRIETELTLRRLIEKANQESTTK